MTTKHESTDTGPSHHNDEERQARLRASLFALPEVCRDPLTRELAIILTSATGETSSGYPYLHPPVFVRLRDWVPVILGHGPRALAAGRATLAHIEAIDGPDGPHAKNARLALRVVRQVVNTASVTAPPDLWLLRHVFSGLHRLGLLQRLADGEVLRLESCSTCRPEELRIDLELLLARGYLVRRGSGWRLADHAAARHVAQALLPLPESTPSGLSALWADAFSGAATPDALTTLKAVLSSPYPDDMRDSGDWFASAAEIEQGYRLVPLILGLRRVGRNSELASAGRVDVGGLIPSDPTLDELTRALLCLVGVLSAEGEVTEIGQRVLLRGPGPFGIIEAYHPYMSEWSNILHNGRGAVHVSRATNIAASQDANSRTFERANDALDRFCADTGFEYRVFIEHAIGRGEATRQRFERSGESTISYWGADLEDPAIDAAQDEKARGNLPKNMRFVRHADIGQPETLLGALRAAGVDAEGAVMLVGNGFHEVRRQTDQGMIEVFEAYEAAGLLLLFTEENALSAEDLLATAWNTYHAGFRYVHARSGQGLRPALPGPPSWLHAPLPMSWTECATRAGYVRPEVYSARSRTIYPSTPPNGHNPSISVNHFFVPGRLARRLGLLSEPTPD